MEDKKELTVEEKVEKVRESVQKLKKVKLTSGLLSNYKIEEHRKKKARNRVRNKMQKLSRKINRKK